MVKFNIVVGAIVETLY